MYCILLTIHVFVGDRRILFGKWLSESWKEFFAEGGQKQVERAFQRCGMLNSIDGSENGLIEVQGIDNYTFDSESSDSEGHGSNESSDESWSEEGSSSETSDESMESADVGDTDDSGDEKSD